MRRTFQSLEELSHIVVVQTGRQSQFPRHHLERFAFGTIGRGQSEAEKVIHHGFERGAGAPGLLLNKTGNVVIERESGAHIMMLSLKTS